MKYYELKQDMIKKYDGRLMLRTKEAAVELDCDRHNVRERMEGYHYSIQGNRHLWSVSDIARVLIDRSVMA